MDASPCTTSITIEFDCQFRVHLKHGDVKVGFLGGVVSNGRGDAGWWGMGEKVAMQ